MLYLFYRLKLQFRDALYKKLMEDYYFVKVFNTFFKRLSVVISKTRILLISSKHLPIPQRYKNPLLPYLMDKVILIFQYT
ncbi:hypothetical protein NMY3_01305 [Candidatus Nitrosocosmicus oleophilus]|uniref:Uncharacterized protein n=1 Tax=Candidatus Nitrosocosmicus oleophilus TaxID=1353260 RepID=A0A654LZ44_9ARCH|nr:hypothetical protein NMY3_01305 [Candidatus Nitrosocosmicus oleophilus]